MHADVVDRPSLRVVTCAHKGSYNRIAEAFNRLSAIAGPAGLFAPGATMLAIYHDDPQTTPESDLHSDAALSVSPTATIPHGLGTATIAEGRYAVATHVGSYDGLGDAWAHLMGEWLPQSGYRVGNGVSYEVYVNNPTNTPPKALRTELYLPLAPPAATQGETA